MRTVELAVGHQLGPLADVETKLEEPYSDMTANRAAIVATRPAHDGGGGGAARRVFQRSLARARLRVEDQFTKCDCRRARSSALILPKLTLPSATRQHEPTASRSIPLCADEEHIEASGSRGEERPSTRLDSIRVDSTNVFTSRTPTPTPGGGGKRSEATASLTALCFAPGRAARRRRSSSFTGIFRERLSE